MPKKHISVVKATVIYLIAAVLILIGFISAFAIAHASISVVIRGLFIMLAGLIIAFVNWLVFAIRTTQLEIDTKEAIRDKIGYVCPNCGQRLPEGSKFCNNCGYKIK